MFHAILDIQLYLHNSLTTQAVSFYRLSPVGRLKILLVAGRSLFFRPPSLPGHLSPGRQGKERLCFQYLMDTCRFSTTVLFIDRASLQFYTWLPSFSRKIKLLPEGYVSIQGRQDNLLALDPSTISREGESPDSWSQACTGPSFVVPALIRSARRAGEERHSSFSGILDLSVRAEKSVLFLNANCKIPSNLQFRSVSQKGKRTRTRSRGTRNFSPIAKNMCVSFELLLNL